jgi:hypothetical protein
VEKVKIRDFINFKSEGKWFNNKRHGLGQLFTGRRKE